MHGLRGLYQSEYRRLFFHKSMYTQLYKALQDKSWEVTDLDLSINDIHDKGARELFENGKQTNIVSLLS